MYRWAIAFLIGTISAASHAETLTDNQDHQLFEKIFSKWVYSFNHKDLAGSCDLFSKKMTANYQGAPAKNYASVCVGFKKIFHESRDYKYHYKLHHVYRSNDLAVARITWYLQITDHGKLISDTQDEGLDVFNKNEKGAWKIVNYLGYPVMPLPVTHSKR